MKNKKVLIIVSSFILIMIIVFSFILFNDTFSKNNISNNELVLKENELFLVAGDTYNLEEIVNYEDKELSFVSNNTEIIKVDAKGNLAALKIGSATISITDQYGNKKECLVHVKSNLERIEFTKENINLRVDDEFLLIYNLYPENAQTEALMWASSDENIVKVENGRVKAIGEGTAIISLKDTNGIVATCEVVVLPKIIEVEQVKLSVTNKDLYVGDTIILNGTILPKDATDKKITWKSSDNSVASVDANGEVTAKKAGKVVITASSSNGKVATSKITVKVVAESIKLNKSHMGAYVGQKVTVSATILPSNTFDKKVTWESSNESIATVDNGTVVIKTSGTVIITAKTSNGKESSCTIEVLSKTKDKSAIFFGDSITYGASGTPKGYSWANYIGDNYDLSNAVNAGKSSWRVSNTKDRFITNIVRQHKESVYDYVIMHGGTNDISGKVPIGTYNLDDFSGNYDDTTFLGGLETYIYTVKQQWPNAKVGYIINYPTPLNNENRKNLSPSYYIEMKKVLDKWNIPYLDLYFGSSIYGQKYSDLLKVNSKKYLSDTLHLNAEGYELISPYIYMWMNTL